MPKSPCQNDIFSRLSPGKARRLKRILPQGASSILVPLDDSLIAGPQDGLFDISTKLSLVATAKPNGIMLFAGLAKRFHLELADIGLIVNLTASIYGPNHQHTRKFLVSDLEQAVQIDADVVAVHVNFTSRYESEMLNNLSTISRSCDFWHVPLMAIMYARSEYPDGTDDNYNELRANNPMEIAHLQAHAARIALDLGADLIKTQFPGSIDALSLIIKAAAPLPVFVGGGPRPKIDNVNDTFKLAEQCLSVGAAGVCFGRRVFGEKNPLSIINGLKLIANHSQRSEKKIESISQNQCPKEKI